MPAVQDLWLFLSASFMLWITPGPDSMYILARTIAQGRLAGAVSVLGISAGTLVHTLLAAIGLSALLATSALAFTVVKFMGAGYLIYLGVQAFRNSSAPARSPAVAAESRQKIFWQGFLTNVLNPKVAVFFVAFLPQFVVPEAGNSAGPLLFLGALFVLGGTLWCLVLVAFAVYFSQAARTNEKVAAIVAKVIGTVYVGLGLHLLRAEV